MAAAAHRCPWAVVPVAPAGRTACVRQVPGKRAAWAPVDTLPSLGQNIAVAGGLHLPELLGLLADSSGMLFGEGEGDCRLAVPLG